MARVGELVVALKAETAAFRRDIEQSRRQMNRMEKTMRSTAAGAKALLGGFVGIGAATAAFRAVVTEVTEAERAAGKLGAVLKATDHAAGLTARSITELADQMSRESLFSDDAIQNAAAQLLTFRNITGDTFREALTLSVDLATVLDTDLKSSILQIGKALNDPVRGVSSLSEAGIQFNTTQRETIAQLIDANRLYEAQAMILEELTRQVGGAAAGTNTGLTGAIHGATKAWSNFLENLGRTQIDDIGALERMFRGIERGITAITPETDPLKRLRASIAETEQMLEGSRLGRLVDAVGGSETPTLLDPFALRGAIAERFSGERSGSSQSNAQLQARLEVLRQQERFLEAQLRMENGLAAAAARRAEEERAVASALEAEKQHREDMLRMIDGFNVRPELAPLSREDEMMVDLLRRREAARRRREQEFFDQTHGDLSGIELKGSVGKLDGPFGSGDAFVQQAKADAMLWAETWENAIRGTQDAFADFFTSLYDQEMSFAAFLDRLGRLWTATIAQMAGRSLAEDLFGGLLKEVIPKAIPGAPDISGALDPQVPIIAAPSLGASATAGGGMMVVHQNVTFSVSAIDARGVQQVLEEQQGTIAGVVAKAARESRGFRAALTS